MDFTALADQALDRFVFLGYTKIGSRLRRLWWPADPEPGAMALSFARLGATVHLLGHSEDKVRRSAGKIRGLVHNAGLIPPERTESAQGHETQLAAHVLGPHLMTQELLPLLQAAEGASVVWMSSGRDVHQRPG